MKIKALTVSADHSYSDAANSLISVFGGSLLIALCAQISIPLYFTPVPLSLQTLAVLLIGTTLGSRKGTLAVLAYLCEVAMGMPVLAGGISDPLAFIGPKGGYLLGFALQAYLVGSYVERQERFHLAKTGAMLIFACLIQLGLGVIWLSNFVGWKHVLTMGFYPFIFGEALKSAIVLQYLKKARRVQENV